MAIRFFRGIALLFFFLGAIDSLSQDVLKFGKISKEDLIAASYEEYGDQPAVIIQDIGSSSFIFDRTNGFRLLFEKHIIIKILSQEGYNWADGEVLLYQNNDTKELIQSLKGFTYNLEGGKLVKTKLSNDAIFSEKKNDYWEAQKFSMPNVKTGSIVEVSYTIVSDFLFNLRSWQFQHEVPTIYSSYTTTVPEYFDYRLVTQGYYPIESTPQ